MHSHRIAALVSFRETFVSPYASSPPAPILAESIALVQPVPNPCNPCICLSYRFVLNGGIAYVLVALPLSGSTSPAWAAEEKPRRGSFCLINRETRRSTLNMGPGSALCPRTARSITRGEFRRLFNCPVILLREFIIFAVLVSNFHSRHPTSFSPHSPFHTEIIRA